MSRRKRNDPYHMRKTATQIARDDQNMAAWQEIAGDFDPDARLRNFAIRAQDAGDHLVCVAVCRCGWEQPLQSVIFVTNTLRRMMSHANSPECKL